MTPNVTISDPGLDTTLTMTVKSGGALVAKASIPVTGGVPTPPTLAFPVTATEDYFIEISGSDPEILDVVTATTVDITLPDTTVVSAALGANGAGPFQTISQPYRGWRTFGYNGNRSAATSPITLTDADLDTPTAAEIAALESQIRTAADNNDQAAIDALIAANESKVFPLAPDVGMSQWTSSDEDLWTSASTVSSTRFGDNFPSVPDPSVFAGARRLPYLRIRHRRLHSGYLFC